MDLNQKQQRDKGSGHPPRPKPNQKRKASGENETDPLLPPKLTTTKAASNPPIPLPPRADNQNRNRSGSGSFIKIQRHDRHDSFDGSASLGSRGASVSSRSSFPPMKLLPWAFQNLSNTMLPSETEVVYESSDDDSVVDEDSISSVEEEGLDDDDDDLSIHSPFLDEEDENDAANNNDEIGGGSPTKRRRSSINHHPTTPPITNKNTIKSPSRKSSQRNSSRSNIAPYPHTPSSSKKHHRHHHHHQQQHHHRVRVKRSIRRRIFLLLTEPDTSIVSALFFTFLIILIALSNIVMMMQTMDAYQFTPDDCKMCGGENSFYSATDDNTVFDDDVTCVCPPAPVPGIVLLEDWIIYVFTVEWTLRFICYEPTPTPIKSEASGLGRFCGWLSFLLQPTTILDALAIFPYYLERLDMANGLLSLRLLRLFRVFQLVRLGQYNVTFMSLTNVLIKSLLSFNLLIIVLVFGAAFFGSMIYWLEKGEWKYTDYTDPPSFMYVRTGVDGVTEEPSPFTSIPASFWWFMVTATTVGYGDTYPTSFPGKCVAAFAMLTGVLVIAFPVSVFSDLWQKELKETGALEILEESSEKSNSLEKGFMNDSGEPKVVEIKKTKSMMGFPDPVREFLSRSSHNIVDNENVPVEKSLSEGIVQMRQKDIDDIHQHLRIINESQQKILSILNHSKVDVSPNNDG